MCCLLSILRILIRLSRVLSRHVSKIFATRNFGPIHLSRKSNLSRKRANTYLSFSHFSRKIENFLFPYTWYTLPDFQSGQITVARRLRAGVLLATDFSFSTLVAVRRRFLLHPLPAHVEQPAAGTFRRNSFDRKLTSFLYVGACTM